MMDYRVMVKMDGMDRYRAVAENDTGVAIAPVNKIYHSYFTLEAAQRLAEELQAAGFDSKVTK